MRGTYIQYMLPCLQCYTLCRDRGFEFILRLCKKISIGSLGAPAPLHPHSLCIPAFCSIDENQYRRVEFFFLFSFSEDFFMARLVKLWPLQPRFQLAVHTSPCIVTQPPPPPARATARRRALVTPANEQLQGTALPYFPMAGPPPKDLATSNWGGMEIGSGMFYATQTVDGVVSRLGGPVKNALYFTPLRKMKKNVKLMRGGGGGAIQHSVISRAETLRLRAV